MNHRGASADSHTGRSRGTCIIHTKRSGFDPATRGAPADSHTDRI